MANQSPGMMSQSKLPAISESRNLVSQTIIRNSPEPEEVGDRDRTFFLQQSSNGQLEGDGARVLIQQISRSFITALQLDTSASWNHLCEVLEVVKPFTTLLRGTPQVTHYVERILHHLRVQEGPHCEKVTETLSAIFPDEVKRAQGGYVDFNRKPKFPTSSPEETLFTPRGRCSPAPRGVRIPRGEPVIPAGSTYIFEQPSENMKHFTPKALSLEDLKRSLPGVVQEISRREAEFTGALGLTALALDVDLPQTQIPTPPTTPKKSISLPVIVAPGHPKGVQTEDQPGKPPMTGREVVEAFVKERFLGELKFAFLNLVPSRRYDPYNLIVVAEEKVNPEHYVISSHCVLHVQPNRPSESQSLADWYKEACQFRAISNIGFFRNFLTSKMFRKWKEIKKLSHFLKTEAEIEKSLLANVPSFGSALLRISGLLQDLAHVTFLPSKTDFCYALEEFEDVVFRTSATGERYVQKFFNYCQMIIDKTQDSCLDYLQYCEFQVKQHRHNYHESLAVAKEKRMIRQHNLKLAREEIRRLGAFASLVDQIISSHLLSLAQRSICGFIDQTMNGPRDERDGLLYTNLIFNDEHRLSLSPSSKQLSHSLAAAVRSVLSSICSLSHAMKLGGGADTSTHTNGKEERNGFSVDKNDVTAQDGEIDGSSTLSTNTSFTKVEADDLFPKIQNTEESGNHESNSLEHSRTTAEIEEDIEALNSELASVRDTTLEGTQELCIRQNQGQGLVVQGERLEHTGSAPLSPLVKSKLEEMLYKDEKISAALSAQSAFVSAAISEVQQFCHDHCWLAEIHAFISVWDSAKLDTWKGQATIKIEKQLNQIRVWTDKVFGVAKSFCTTNGLLFVDCHEIQNAIIPKLNGIFKELASMIAVNVLDLSDEVVQVVEALSEDLKEQKTDIKGFAEFMQQLQKVKENVPSLKEKVEYIKNLFEVIRSCYRQLTPEEEVTEEKVWTVWEGFLFVLQEASDFIHMQIHLMTERLTESITSLEQSAEEIGKEATSGPYLDPNENPATILDNMRKLREKFSGVRNRLSDLGKCKVIIMGEPYDMSRVTQLQLTISKRAELWKLCQASSHTVREWLFTVFKKMNVKKAMEKLQEWLSVGQSLKQHLPDDDEVLVSWLNQLDEFSQDLPLLLQLSSDSLKSRHWRALFIGMGQEYDPSWDFTVADLLSFNLGRYKDLIATVCAGAAAEYALEVQLHQLTRAWQERDFKLAKHIPLMRSRLGSGTRRSATAKGSRRNKQDGKEKAKPKAKPKTPSSVPDLYILIGIGELKCLIEDNLVTLHTMRVSPHIVDLKASVETWIANLQQLEDLLDIWTDCQTKWLYLSIVFAEPVFRRKFADEQSKFADVDDKYRELIRVILKDAKVLSVLTRRRGEKSWREMQGETLRSYLLGVVRTEEELIKSVEDYMERARLDFPRLYFVSDSDLLSLLAWSRNPKELLPFARKCFPGIKSLRFALPHDTAMKLGSALDAALNAHLLQVTALEGTCSEVVPLCTPIPASPRPQKWLAALEQNMRDTLVRLLGKCVERRLAGIGDVSAFVHKLVHADPESLKEENLFHSSKDAVESESNHLMLKFPAQCVVTAEAIAWTRGVNKALESGDSAKLLRLKTSADAFVEDLAKAIRKICELKSDNAVFKRLDVLLGSLIVTAVRHRDVIRGLISSNVSSLHSFEWQSELQHHLDTTPVISSSYSGHLRRTSLPGSLDKERIPVDYYHKMGRCSVQHLGSDFAYGYEYLGPTTRLVITPLTQRCLLTLTAALRSYQCGTPVGSDGTGKTESIKELAKTLGRHLMTFDSTEGLTTPILVRYLTGMLQAGSWVCFENLHTVQPGVLSVFASQLDSIRTALKSLEKSRHSQYTVRGIAAKDLPQESSIKRRSSLTTLHVLPREERSPLLQKTTENRVLLSTKRRCLTDATADFTDADSHQSPHSSKEARTSLLRTYQDAPGMWRSHEIGVATFEMPLLGSVVFDGKLMAASEMYGCFMTMPPSYSRNLDLPENLRALIRPIAMLLPDSVSVLEVWLTCGGFTEAKALAQKISTFFKLVSEQLYSQDQYTCSLRGMRSLVSQAGAQLCKELDKKRTPLLTSINEAPSNAERHTEERETRSPFLESMERRQTEENSVVSALFAHFGKKLLPEDRELFSQVVDDVFVHSVLMSANSDGDPRLVNEVKEYFQAHGLHHKPEIIAKVLQLHRSLLTNQSVVLLGPSGAGKTTLYQALAGAINNLNNQAAVSTRPRRLTVSERRISTQVPPTSAAKTGAREIPWPRVDLTVTFPKSLTCEELFGKKNPDSQLWIDGLISKYLRDSTLINDTATEALASQATDKQRLSRGIVLSRVDRWLVLDGPMSGTWMDSMGSLLDTTRKLSLLNGDTLAQPDTVTLLFEVSDLANTSPAMVARCAVVHCPENLVGWKPIFRTWLKGAHAKWDVSNRSLGIISCLMDHVVDSSLDFLSEHCCHVMNVDSRFPPRKATRGLHEVQTLLRLLSAIFDRHILREDEDRAVQIMKQKQRQSVSSLSSRQSSGLAASDTSRVITTFAFAFIWAFGGHLHDRSSEKFDEHARAVLSSGPYSLTIPPEGTVYDYYLDFSKGQLMKWQDRPGAQNRTLSSSYTVVPEVDRYFFLLDLLISARQPVLLVGNPGVGKSSLIQNLVNPRYSYTRLAMSRGLTSRLLQEAIEDKLQQIQRREMKQLAAQQNLHDGSGRNLPHLKTRPQLMFLDDLNYAGADAHGNMPPLELLRQILSQGVVFDKERQHYRQVQQLQFIATAVPPGSTCAGGGIASQPISARLSRLMTVISFFPLPVDTQEGIYSSVFQAWLEEFPAYSLTHHELLAKKLAAASVKMFGKICEELRPSPLHPHFLFSPHELSRVAQGMALFSTRSRGRPRPRIRRRGAGRGDGGEEKGAGSFGVSRSDPNVSSRNRNKKSSVLSSSQSWPALVGEDSITTVKTPAVISPLIRSLVRLWCHETVRTYSDRLLTEEQRYWFSTLLNEQVEECFCTGSSESKDYLVLEKHEEPEHVFQDVTSDAVRVSPGASAPPPTREEEGNEDEPLVYPGDSVEDPEFPDGSTTSDDEESVVSADRAEADVVEPTDTVETAEDEGNRPLTTPKPDEEHEPASNTNEDEETAPDPSTARSNQESQPGRSKVTFDDISGDGYDKNYDGPLISLEQLSLPGEDLTEIVFCKHFNVSLSGSVWSASDAASRSYVECADAILEQGVGRCLESYNSQAVKGNNLKKIDLATFRQVLHHASRLSRALATPAGHALLLSCQGWGRRTLTRLAAHAAGLKLMEAKPSQLQSREELRQQIKAAGYIAGLQGKQVVMFIPEGLDDAAMEDICSLMAEGTCPGLYTASELSMIAGQLLPGGQRGARRTENQDIAQERFFRRIKTNLHIVVCLKYAPLTVSDSPLRAQLCRFPTLIMRSCCVDVYHAWPHEALVCVAQKCLESGDALSQVPWKRRERESQMAAIASVMAHAHLSGRSMAQRVHGVKGGRLYSPDTFLDFIDLFSEICRRICVLEKEKISQLDKVIMRIEESNDSINMMERELTQLSPVLEAAQKDVRQWQESVESSQREYTEEKEKCKKQELEIEKMAGPIEVLKQEAQTEFDKINPMFEAALNAINSLEIHDLEEIRSYRTPPDLVRLVASSICLLFNVEQTWEDGKLLLNRDNFFKDLEFYDVKNMPDRIYNSLKTFYDNPKFQPLVVREGSVAACSLCEWVRAVYEYCGVYRLLEPKRQQLRQAQDELQKAKSILGEMRVRCNAIKQELESKIQSYKDSMKHAKSVDKQIQGIEARKARSLQLVNSMATYSDTWEESRTVSKQRLVTAPGDALVTAACVCYLGPLTPAARDELFSDLLRVCDGTNRPDKTKRTLASVMLRDTDVTQSWIRKGDDELSIRGSRPVTCGSVASTVSGSVVPLRDGISLEGILSYAEELDEWKRQDLPACKAALHSVLIMSTCAKDCRRSWPLLIDPHDQAELWVRALHQGDQLSKAASSRPESRISGRSLSRRSGRSSALDYAELGQDEVQERETHPHTSVSDGEEQDMDEQFFEYTKESDEQASSYLESDTPTTTRTGQTGALSAMTTITERAFRAKLAEELGIQIDSTDLASARSPTPSLFLDEGEILLLPADDPHFVGKLRAAVITGVVVLVTHLERRRLDESLELLLARQTFTTEKGRLQVMIGKTAIDYNQSFHLYLSSSMPLFMPGEGLAPLPVSKACVIDMSISLEGVRDLLLIDTLSLERPEVDGQQRSLDRDLTLHRQQVTQAEEFVLNKVLNLTGPLLKDTTMLSTVSQSKGIIQMARERETEAQTMQREILTKREDFLPVADHGALLYMVICELSKLHPCYYFPLDSFIALYHQTISERNRGKRGSGSAAARAAELITALSRKVYARFSWSLFLGDNHVFPFLVAVEKMLRSDQITEEEWQLFTRQSHTPISLSNRTGEDTPSRPAWLSPKVWKSIEDLELLSAFAGLKESILENSRQWKEYFNLPPVLLGSTPGNFKHLTVFQKALLWKTLREDQLFQVSRDIVLYHLGADMIQPVGYKLERCYSLTNNATPILFLLPSKRILQNGGRTVLKDPVTDVIELARAHGKRKDLYVVTLGEVQRMEMALRAVELGMTEGHWVVLQNCHLATSWSPEFLQKLQTITSTPIVHCDETEALSEKDSYVKSSISKVPDAVHADFRLFVTTRTDEGLALPAVLIQRGLKLACEAKSNLKDTVKTNLHMAVRSLGKWTPVSGQAAKTAVLKSYVPVQALYSLVFFHSVLRYRRLHGKCAFTCLYQWSQHDLQIGTEVLHRASLVCFEPADRANLPVNAVGGILGDVIYGGHTAEQLDLRAVTSLARWTSSDLFAEGLTGKTTDSATDVNDYMEDTADDLSAAQLGLPATSSGHLQLAQSKQLASDLERSTGVTWPAPRLECEIKGLVENLLDVITKTLDSTKRAEPNPSTPQTAVVCFLRRESDFFSSFLCEITRDLRLLLGACEGRVFFTPHLHRLAECLARLEVPRAWLARCADGIALPDWIEELRCRVRAVAEYVLPEPLQPQSFCLGAFVHQQAFLASVLIDHAKSHTKSSHSLKFNVEVMQSDFHPSSPPSRGVYVTGLQLRHASWDASQQRITDEQVHADRCELPITWFKPVEQGRSPLAEGDNLVYDCPLRTIGVNDSFKLAANLVSSLPLPSDLSVDVLKQRRVALVPGLRLKRT